MKNPARWIVSQTLQLLDLSDLCGSFCKAEQDIGTKRMYLVYYAFSDYTRVSEFVSMQFARFTQS